jgi:hypothetical protein
MGRESLAEIITLSFFWRARWLDSTLSPIAGVYKEDAAAVDVVSLSLLLSSLLPCNHCPINIQLPVQPLIQQRPLTTSSSDNVCLHCCVPLSQNPKWW